MVSYLHIIYDHRSKQQRNNSKRPKAERGGDKWGFWNVSIEEQRVCSPGLASFPLNEIEDKINNFTATTFGCLRFTLFLYPQ